MKTKSDMYQALKKQGYKFDRGFVYYTKEEMADIYDEYFTEKYEELVENVSPSPDTPVEEDSAAELLAAERHADLPPSPTTPPEEVELRDFGGVIRSDEPVDKIAGLRQNQPLVPLRIDSADRVWYQEEVRKPSGASPRGRRKLQYVETGTRVETVQNGEYTESFEVSDSRRVPSEVRVTLPSYQVGIYKSPRFPFLIHTYGGRECFDLFQVEEYFGGPEMVPAGVGRVYVENVLGYDIRQTVRAINDLARELRLI